MAVKLRLTRMGAKKAPRYRIVAADSRNARDGKVIETIGYVNPTTDPATVSVNEELAMKWLRVGAQPSGQERSEVNGHGRTGQGTLQSGRADG